MPPPFSAADSPGSRRPADVGFSALLELLEDRGGSRGRLPDRGATSTSSFSDPAQGDEGGGNPGTRFHTRRRTRCWNRWGREFLAAEHEYAQTHHPRTTPENIRCSATSCRLLRGQERSLTDPKEVVLEHLAMLLPDERPERMFATLVGWGRFAELFGYNKDADRFYLDERSGQALKLRR